MKILWISNVIFPEACKELGITPPVVGGWMQSGADALIDMDNNITLAVASLYHCNEIKKIKGERITYYLIPSGKDNLCFDHKKVISFTRVIQDFNPNLVHIHGSEYPHSLAAAMACGNTPFVVSVQGLVSRYYYYYYGGIREKEVHSTATLRDLLRCDRVEDQCRKMGQRGIYEQELYRKSCHVIGRTSWDKSCIWAINPKTKYHFCNETLRPAFYKTKWNYEDCEHHSIFISQAYYPLKGVHQLFEALPLILRTYPDTQVCIAGNNILNAPWYKRNGYANYLLKIIHKYSLESCVRFLGTLSEQEMADRFAKSHVFVSASSIENSPNSVGEAQLVGTPVIGSYVGGTMDMITDGETGFLYRFEEISLLAMRICQLFESPKLCKELSEKEREVARKRHDGETNAKQLCAIYYDILGQ